MHLLGCKQLAEGCQCSAVVSRRSSRDSSPSGSSEPGIFQGCWSISGSRNELCLLLPGDQAAWLGGDHPSCTLFLQPCQWLHPCSCKHQLLMFQNLMKLPKLFCCVFQLALHGHSKLSERPHDLWGLLPRQPICQQCMRSRIHIGKQPNLDLKSLIKATSL